MISTSNRRCNLVIYAQAMPFPDPKIEYLLVQGGFLDVAKLRQVKIDGALVITLVERWRSESHTFDLPIGNAQSP